MIPGSSRSVFGPCNLAGERLFSGSLLDGGLELGTLTRQTNPADLLQLLDKCIPDQPAAAGEGSGLHQSVGFFQSFAVQGFGNLGGGHAVKVAPEVMLRNGCG